MDANPHETAFPKLRFAQIAVGGSLFFFAAWCVVDLVSVRFSLWGDKSLDWLLLVLPIVTLFGGIKALADVQLERRIGLSILATIVAIILAVALIVTVGIPFHFSIGGEL